MTNQLTLREILDGYKYHDNPFYVGGPELTKAEAEQQLTQLIKYIVTTPVPMTPGLIDVGVIERAKERGIDL